MGVASESIAKRAEIVRVEISRHDVLGGSGDERCKHAPPAANVKDALTDVALYKAMHPLEVGVKDLDRLGALEGGMSEGDDYGNQPEILSPLEPANDLAHANARAPGKGRHEHRYSHDKLIRRYGGTVDPGQNRRQHDHGPTTEFRPEPRVHRLKLLFLLIHGFALSNALCL